MTSNGKDFLSKARVAVFLSANSQQTTAGLVPIHFTTLNKMLRGKREMPDWIRERLTELFPSLED